MGCNFLLLNSEKKTEILIIGQKTPSRNNLEYCLTLAYTYEILKVNLRHIFSN